MAEFFINHTHKKIVRAEKDAGFNIAKNLRETMRQYGWSLDDHIEFAISDRIAHPYGVDLLINRKYELVGWVENLRHFLITGSQEYRDIMLQDDAPFTENCGPYGV
jgi:hypothetical protein